MGAGRANNYIKKWFGRGAMINQSQRGSAIIVVLIASVLLTIIGVMAIRSGIFGLRLATNSQAMHIMDQNNDAALFKIEDSNAIANYLIGTGLFGLPKMVENRGKELVICYRGSSSRFYQVSRASLIDPENVSQPDHIGGSARMGFCQVDNDKTDFVSGRGAAMTQIAIRVGGLSEEDDEAFSHYQEGTDNETGKLDENLRVVVTTTTVMPVLSSLDADEINPCMENLSYTDQADSSDTVSECLSKLNVPYKTQVAEYSLGQFIKKV